MQSAQLTTVLNSPYGSIPQNIGSANCPRVSSELLLHRNVNTTANANV